MKRLLILVAAVAVSGLYLTRAAKSWGVAGAAFFIIVWTLVFIYQVRRSRRMSVNQPSREK